jgi:hypothetical protein
MTRKLTSVAIWFTADPNRIRLTLVVTALALSILGASIPGLQALADGAPGGSGNP